MKNFGELSACAPGLKLIESKCMRLTSQVTPVEIYFSRRNPTVTHTYHPKSFSPILEPNLWAQNTYPRLIPPCRLPLQILFQQLEQEAGKPDKDDEDDGVDDDDQFPVQLVDRFVDLDEVVD